MLSSRFFSIFLSLFFRHLGRMLDLPTTARSRLLSLIPMLGNRHVNHETNRNGSTILIVLSIVPSMRCKTSNFSTLKVDLIHNISVPYTPALYHGDWIAVYTCHAVSMFHSHSHERSLFKKRVLVAKYPCIVSMAVSLLCSRVYRNAGYTIRRRLFTHS